MGGVEAVGEHVVVVVAQLATALCEAADIEQFVAQATNRGLGEGVLNRLAYTHSTRRRRPDTRSPRLRCDPFARDVAFDPGRASSTSHNGAAHVAFERMKTLGPCDV